MALPINIWGQEKEQKVMEELVNMGFENVRWVENETEQIYTIENNVYRLSGIGVKEAISIIQKEGLPKNKICKIIVTHLDIPQVALTYTPSIKDLTNNIRLSEWKTSYKLGNSWEEVKTEKKKKRLTL